jgi:hypothetical protein
MNIKPTRKATAGGLGSGVVGVPLAALLSGVLAANGVEISPEATAALGGVLTALMGFIASWLTPES